MLSLLLVVLASAEPLAESGVERPPSEAGQASNSELPLLKPEPKPETEFSSFEPGLGWMLFQTVLVLAGVVLLAYILLSWGGKRLLQLRDGGGQRAITIVERVSVDAKKSLLLVKVAKDYFLLSSGERALTVLSKLNTEDLEQALSNKATGESSVFLKKLLERKTTKKGES